MKDNSQESVVARDIKASKVEGAILFGALVLAFAQFGIVLTHSESIADLIGTEDLTVKTTSFVAWCAIMLGGFISSHIVVERISPGHSERYPSRRD